jgi:hypothetical protein
LRALPLLAPSCELWKVGVASALAAQRCLRSHAHRDRDR